MDPCAVDELYEAFAVLAGSDPDHCSYPKGYVKRQAVFSCHTCVEAGMDPAGVCLACANVCHDGHDVCELYTKRDFRCDCGNDKFSGFRCRLTAKEGQNVKNSYNHNFLGRYCSCDRPYPDEGDQVNDEMIQCIVCEDWFHEKHLEAPAAAGDALTEMICVQCMNRAPFLWTYAAHFSVSPSSKCKELTNADVTSEEKGKCSSGHDTASASPRCPQEETTAVSAAREPEPGAVVRHTAVTCVLKELKTTDADTQGPAAVFWPYYWRAKLCTCTDCKRMYVETGVPFLLDESDTLLAYEERGRAETLTADELLLTCMSSRSPQQQLEIAYQYSELKQELREFLKQSVDQDKEVSLEDFRGFVEELQRRKRRRLD